MARLDKWLQVARAFKTRSAAARACALGRVRVNGERAKAHRRLAVGDRIAIERREWTQVWVVRGLADRPVARAVAATLYEDRSPPRPEPDPLARLQRQAPVARERGAGRPTKKERREMERFRR